MWTKPDPETCDPGHQGYLSGLNCEKQQILAQMLPLSKDIESRRIGSLREMINGIRYMRTYGISCDAMPKDLRPDCIWHDSSRVLPVQRPVNPFNHVLIMPDREKAGRKARPTLTIIDAQSVEGGASDGARGCDAAKKVLGRKRHVTVDNDGPLLSVDATTADVQGRDGGPPQGKCLVRRGPGTKTIVGDGNCKSKFIEGVRTLLSGAVEAVRRPIFFKNFVLLPKFWHVEQTLRTLTGSRRLKTDYDHLIRISTTMMFFTSMTRVLAPMTAK